MVAIVNRRDKIIKITCMECLETFNLRVDADDHFSWQHGVLIQDAFPYLNAGERELLISGYCSDCFDSIFSEE